MDAQNQVQNVSIKEESVDTNPQTQNEESLQNPKQDTDISAEENKDTTKEADSLKDASEAGANVTVSQPRTEDIATPDESAQDTTFPKDQDNYSTEKPDSSQKAEEIVADSLPKQDQGIESSEDATVPTDQEADNSEVTLPKDAESSEQAADVTNSQLKPEDTIPPDDPAQHETVPADESTNQGIPSNDIDSHQNSAKAIDEVPRTENDYPVVSDKQNGPIDDDRLSSNSVASQTISPSTENNGSTQLTQDKDNAVVTINDDTTPAKTNGTEEQPASSKTWNYCLENWLLVFAICLIILTVIGTIIMAVFIVPILSKQVIRPFRLPGNVIPENYILDIQPSLLKEKPEFEGTVVITILCVNSTNKLILHSRGLEIDEDRTAVVNLSGGHSPFVLRTQYDLENEFVIFSLCEHLENGTKYDVHIVFKGRFSNRIGFMMKEYEKNDEPKLIAYTKFESIYARRAFPCFDEPALKATFDINIVRWKNMSSLSNMKRLTTIEKDKDWEIDLYQRSVLMSTYLVAFVVGELENIEMGKVLMWAEKDIDFYEYALNVSDTLLKFYESYLGVPYSLPKLDQLAIESYVTGGMEHWGLIIYRSDLVKSGESRERSIARLISHELAHQWFGNLVTMKWWDGLWLNEGFAAYFGYFGTNVVNPEWKMDDSVVQYIDVYFNKECRDVVRRDSPIQRSFESTNEIENYLREVVYKKGAALVRMMHMLLGDDVFRKGLKSYLEENAFGSVVQEDLWRHLTMAQPLRNRIDMKKLMEPWTKHSYYPLITVTRKYADHEATVEQTSCTNPLGKESKVLWTVPITLIDGTKPHYKNTTVKLMLDSEKANLPNLPGKETWILVNVERLGYFRVNYDATNWELLLWQLRHNFKIIPMLNRRQLILDALFFAKINELSHEVALDIITYYPFEKEQMVLNALVADFAMDYYRNTVRHTDAEIYWMKFVEYLFKPTFIRHGRIWDEEEEIQDDNEHFKWYAAGLLCYEGYPPCLTVARIKFKDLLEGKSLPKPLPRTALAFLRDVCCALARYATVEEWNNMNRFFQNDSHLSFHSSLVCTENDQLFQRWLSDAFYANRVFLLTPVILSEKRWKLTIEFLATHWKETNEHEWLLRTLAMQPHKQETFDMAKEFYEMHKNDLSDDSKKEIEKQFSIRRRLIPSPEAIETVKTWLKSKSWENIDIREI